MHQSRHNRAAGTGAGTFPFSHYRFRANGGVVKHAHSQWFNVLSELGVVGLALFVAATALFLAAMVGNPFARRRDRLHPLLVALQAGTIAFFVHISADWDWDMAAIGTLAFVFIAVCVSYRATQSVGEMRAPSRTEARVEDEAPEETGDEPAEGNAGDEPAEADAGDAAEGAAAASAEADNAGGSGFDGASRMPRRRSPRVGWAPRVVACAALLLLAMSWLPPYLAQRSENEALAAASDGDVAAALDSARRAAAWDPLAVSPLLTQATLLQQLGRNRDALERLQAATKLQPQNYEVWYELGLLYQGAFGRDNAARAAFTRALALNPLDMASRYELQLLAR
jgi:cytochrome c-type biogenesis protein CcmH/NrfG